MTARIPPDVLNGVIKVLGLESVSSIQSFSFLGGGCINSGGMLTSSKGAFFLKWNDVNRFPGMFEAESRGLELLAGQQAIRIPTVIGYGEETSHQFLLLEYISQARRNNAYWEQLGIRLAGLHNAGDTRFGLDHDNFIGSLRQYNSWHLSWVDFFIEQRLDVQLKLSIDSGIARPAWAKKFHLLYKKLPALLPQEKPSLLHGDLWSGNLITDDKGEPCLIDPAVYYGNREAELAMTRLFGGFADEFYIAYEKCSAIQHGYQQRFDLYNLYPLLVHVNLFGGSYVGSVDAILNRFE